MAVGNNQQTILDLLRGLKGIEPLKELFWTELNYDRANALIPTGSWTDTERAALAGDPLLFAAAGQDNDFHILYCRLHSSNQLHIADERILINRLIRDHLYGLFVFSDASQEYWHFVNVRNDPDVTKRRIFRRISVSPEERLRTAAERISLLDIAAMSPDLFGLTALDIQTAHDDAFNVEAVTDQFFKDYESVFRQVEQLIDNVKGDKRLFTQRLFNRLLFIQFLQKKGWLRYGGSTDYLPALLRASDDDNEDFYADRLYWLFFCGLGTVNDSRFAHSLEELVDIRGEVPYLNGGLFEMEDEDDVRGQVSIPNDAFRLIISDLFARYNFTVMESTPLDVEVAVDPEMLGKIFEELVTGRHATGSYYTPKPVVSLMCREGLKGYLAAVTQESGEAIELLVDSHDESGLIAPDQVLSTLRRITACDPACGSGAYILGMLHELVALRLCLHCSVANDSESLYDTKLEIIQNNIYGVDLDQFAVNIARLRLWLSLVVEDERNPLDHPGVDVSLPNLDFKIEMGDSLTAPDPSGGMQPDMFRAQQLERFLELKGEYLRCHDESKTGLRASIQQLRQAITQWAHTGTHSCGFDWAVEFAEVFGAGGFDVVLANPPYLSTKHGFGRHNRALLARSYKTATGQFDAYELFIERAFSLLKSCGCYSYIVPKPVLTNSSMHPVRQVMLDHRLFVIADPGQVFKASVEPIVVIGQKSAPEHVPIRIYDDAVFSDSTVPALMKTRAEMVTPAGAWNILPPSGTSDELGCFQGLPTLGTLFTIARGIECGKHDSCIGYRHNAGAYPLLRGEDVDRQNISFSGLYITRDTDTKKLKPLSLYDPPKLLVRRVANQLIAAVDEVGYHVLNTVYIGKPRPGCQASLDYICAVLNSRVMNEYFRACFVNDDKLFPYIRKEQIESLPIALPTPAEDKEIRDLLRQSDDLRDAAQHRVEEIIRSVYSRHRQSERVSNAQ